MTSWLKALFAGFLLVLSGLAAAQELPPPPGKPKPFELAAPATFALDNGLEATLVQFGAVPKVTITVAVEAGNLHEGPDTWLADVVGELMKEGTAARDAQALAVALADMGGALTVNVTPDQTMIAADVLSDFGSGALALLADVVKNPALPEGELNRVKSNLLRTLSVGRSQPRALAQEAFLGLTFGDHPYGVVFPQPQQLSAYTIEQARAFYQENFGAARTHIYVVGRFDEEEMERAIRRAFRDWRPGPPKADDPPEATEGFRVKLVPRPGSQQATVILGQPAISVSHPDYVPFNVMHTLLAGAFSSRITANIREEKGYTYSPSGSITHRKGLAYWTERADVTNEVTGPAIHEIFSEISRLQAEPPPPDEAAKTRNYLAGIFVLQNGSRAGITGQLAFLDLQGVDYGFLNAYVERVLEVTPDQISAMAGSHLPLDDMTLVVVGDLDVVGEQVRALLELEGAEFME